MLRVCWAGGHFSRIIIKYIQRRRRKNTTFRVSKRLRNTLGATKSSKNFKKIACGANFTSKWYYNQRHNYDYSLVVLIVKIFTYLSHENLRILVL